MTGRSRTEANRRKTKHRSGKPAKAFHRTFAPASEEKTQLAGGRRSLATRDVQRTGRGATWPGRKRSHGRVGSARPPDLAHLAVPSQRSSVGSSLAAYRACQSVASPGHTTVHDMYLHLDSAVGWLETSTWTQITTRLGSARHAVLQRMYKRDACRRDKPRGGGLRHVTLEHSS